MELRVHPKVLVSRNRLKVHVRFCFGRVKKALRLPRTCAREGGLQDGVESEVKVRVLGRGITSKDMSGLVGRVEKALTLLRSCAREGGSKGHA